jgi:iron complex outermembrane receptor protein
MKQKLFRVAKCLIFVLIGSSLLWHVPLITYAEEQTETSATIDRSDTQPETSAETTTEQSEYTLEEIKVTARRDTSSPTYSGGQVARDANLGVLGDKDFMDTPFNVTSYTAETIEDQQADTLYDVLINDPSVRFTTPTGHSNENYKIRGIDVNYQYLYFNGMQGLAPQYHVPVEFLERVEVLKGPSSFLYGGVNTSVGGAINLVPKRAGEEDITTFTIDYTSSSRWGGHIDIGRRFGKNKEWGIRFNGLYADGDTEVDGQSKERMLGALGIDYQNDRWRLSLDAYGSEESYDNGAPSMYYLVKGYVKAPDGSTNAYKGTSGKMRNNAVLIKGEYDIVENLTVYAGIGTLSANATGFTNGNHVLYLQADGMAYARNVYKQNFWNDTTSSELGLRGTYLTGAIKHQVVLGANFMDTDFSNAFTQGTGSYATNIYNPVSLADYFNSLTQPAKGNKTLATELSGFVLSDTLSFAKEKVQLTLGIRQQNVKQTSYKYSNNNLATGALKSAIIYDSDATTPMVGLIVKPWGESVSFYANYIEALSPGTVVSTVYANANEVLAPYKTKQHEIGVKWDKGNFANTLSLFQIKMPSSMTTDNIYSYDGEQRNRGVEWNAFGTVAKNLRLLGGVAYTEGELVRSNTSANNGNTPFAVPEWTMNAGVEWDTPWNKDLTLSLRSIYTSSQYINNANTIEIPSWVRYDIGVRYKSLINNTILVTYRFSVENLFDKHYWAGCFNNENYVTLGAPRTIKLSATMQF